ncbi:hypothetical protein D0866_03274 [Hortaea werneckii]|uniref:NB-ARC domain-containing protein n=1 Tax=Hortaea werneckii TaxID=91943 RepID=A0A3M7BC57_HORWE|nr:hypothetical protein D0866_03274 [Hortaea werneckii]
MDPNLVSNKSFGAGGQENLQQIGGSRNVQYNADIINYHGGRVQEPTRTPPPPSSTVPFHRDPNFVDRPELEALEEKLAVWNKKVALLAIEFCYRIRDRSPEVWTFWVHASSAARFDADIRKLACDAVIPGWDDPKSDAFTLVYSWLRDERNGKWLLVLDNVDDASFLFEKRDDKNQSARIRIAYFPPCAHGSTLITSRSRAAVERFADECNVIVVSQMREVTALALLENKLGQSAAMKDMRKLAVALDYMPLALAQAAAYIKQRIPRYSVGRYLAELEESEKSQTGLLSSSSKELRRDEEAQNSIILTLQISFQQVLKERPSAADLLSLMSMYNYQGIPEYLISAEWSGTNKDFNEDIVTLEEFLFISTTMSSTTCFEMHRLVQVAARAWLRSQKKYQEWVQKACQQLDEAFPPGEFENWGRCEELYPHVTSTLSLHLRDQELSPRRTSIQDDGDHETFLSRASIQYKAAWFDLRRGLFSKAESLIAESYETKAALLGMEDEEALSALSFHGVVLSDQGEDEAAEDKIRRALVGKETVLEKDHSSTLASVSHLATVLFRQEKDDKAEEAIRRALKGKEKKLGKEHPDTLTCLNILAKVLRGQGKYAEAEEASRQALQGREKVLGMEHLHTLTSSSDLAKVLSRQGNYEAAEAASRRALEGFERALGTDHPETLLSVCCHAEVMKGRGRQVDAVSLYKRAVAGFSVSLGVRHANTVLSQGSLERLQNDIKSEENGKERQFWFWKAITAGFRPA